MSSTSAAPTSGASGASGTTSASDTDATSVAATSNASQCAFICEPDLGDVPPGLHCDIYDPNSCPEGQKCAFFGPDWGTSWEDTKCVPVTGDGVEGDPCVVELPANSGVDDCGPQHMCWNVDEQGEGTCIAFCGGSLDAPTCPPGYVILGGRVLCFCVPECDPLLQDCAGEGELCTLFDEGLACVLDASEGMHPPGTHCEFPNSCNPGSACVSALSLPTPACEGASGCCAPFCDLTEGTGPENPACAPLVGDVPGIGCVPVYEEGQSPPWLESVGICVLP